MRPGALVRKSAISEASGAVEWLAIGLCIRSASISFALKWVARAEGFGERGCSLYLSPQMGCGCALGRGALGRGGAIRWVHRCHFNIKFTFSFISRPLRPL